MSQTHDYTHRGGLESASKSQARNADNHRNPNRTIRAPLKPIETSAATTAFCAAMVDGPGGFLWVDGNGKITADNGTLDHPKPNSFSLVEIADCPGSTSICRTACYVHGLAKHAPETHALYQHNSREIRRILASIGLATEWGIRFGEWIGQNCKSFRWHVSGDIFSAGYAQWIAFVCRHAPSVNFWIYTRSFDFVPHLDAKNLVVNLSADSDNFEQAWNTSQLYDKRICYLTIDGIVPTGLPDGSVIFPDYSLRGGSEKGRQWFDALSPHFKSFVCPVDYHGKSENRRCGPCDRCLKQNQTNELTV